MIFAKNPRKYSMHELRGLTESTTRHVVTGLAAGANDYIAKPVNSMSSLPGQ